MPLSALGTTLWHTACIASAIEKHCSLWHVKLGDLSGSRQLNHLAASHRLCIIDGEQSPFALGTSSAFRDSNESARVNRRLDV